MKERVMINILGVRVDVVDTQGLCKKVIEFVLDGKQHKIMYVNADCLLLSLKNKFYQQVINKADLVYADGIGVVWGARILGHHLPGRSTGADFVPDFCKVFADHDLGIYLIGAREGVAEEAANRLKMKVPHLKIVGTHHGYFAKEDRERIIASINNAKPHILLVGFGAPYQEMWIDEHATRLQASVIWGVGGLFDFLSGRTRRGPQLLLNHGFEWLCRLIVEPRRLWRRYLIGNTKFVYYLLRHRFIG